MDELIGRFKDLTLPSRSSTLPETFKRLNDEEIEGLLHKVLQKPNILDYRKLREIVVMSHPSRRIAIKVYEHSALHSLGDGEFAEFITAANRLVRDYYKDDGADWVYCALLLFYGSESNGQEDLESLYYRLPKRFFKLKWMTLTIEMLVAIEMGNIKRVELLSNADDMPKLPRNFTDHIRTACLTHTKRAFSKAYRDDVPLNILE